MHLVSLCEFFLAKIANLWLTGPPKFSTIPGLNFDTTAAGNSDMNLVDQNQLKVFLLHNILKISEIAKNWRSREPRICNFCQIFLPRLPKCITLKSILVNNLSLVSVRNALLFMEFLLLLSHVRYIPIKAAAVHKSALKLSLYYIHAFIHFVWVLLFRY